MRRLLAAAAAAVLIVSCPSLSLAQQPRQAAKPVSPLETEAVLQPPPRDLRPLLVPRGSETRLVAQRYALDRLTLAANYLGVEGTGFGRGRGVTAPPPSAPALSPGRIARLKRFDLDWQAAVRAVDRNRLTAAGKIDLDRLESTIAANLTRLDEDVATLARLLPLLPFAPAVVELVEARIRVAPIDPRHAAGIVSGIAREAAAIRERVEAGLAAEAPVDALRVERALAEPAAAAVTLLKRRLTEWFTFYNGYDPDFTWWLSLPFKHADEALEAYGSLLAGKVVPADLATGNVPAAAPLQVEPAPPPPYPSVPDLGEIIALPHDELAAIVARFRGPERRLGGSPQAPPAPQGAAPGSAQPGQAAEAASRGEVVRDRAFYEGWLKALRTLRFDRLSRTAQIDYLYIKAVATGRAARAHVALPEIPPRKTDDTGIEGPARGRQGLVFDLQDELIPYTPEELIAIGERELAWCEGEMRKASREMGLGDDWKAALEKVKTIHPPPGGQPAVVRDLVQEAVDYLRAHDLLTVPAVAAESLRMIMMTPERQLVNPFFTGGNVISVSYPTNTMEHEAKLQSMRGNNTPFSHATAFHEMIPGHNLVFYTSARLAGLRPDLGGNSPFYSEGWPLYWELLFYDLGFHDTPEERIGALFWRMHRAARIIFSLRFHMGEWSPRECIEFLVERVGFERDNAAGEVRRSFNGSYPPLYQLAYLVGGLQLRAIRRELVDGGSMPQKTFHDEVLRQGNMPLALLRLALGRHELSPGTKVEWRFD
jgi:hypothetical protein